MGRTDDPFAFQDQGAVSSRDWGLIYSLDRDESDPFKLTDILPATDVKIEYQHDGVLVTVYGEEGLHLAEVKAPSADQAVAAMPAFVRDSLQELLGL